MASRPKRIRFADERVATIGASEDCRRSPTHDAQAAVAKENPELRSELIAEFNR